MTRFVLLVLPIFFLASCIEESIYHIDMDLPEVRTINREINEGKLSFNGIVDKSDPTMLLRYGFIWGNVEDLNFANNAQLINYSETLYNSVQLNPLSYTVEANNEFDRNQRLFYNAFAINENGISYGSTQSICNDVYFDRYEILEEQIEDNIVNPGEDLTLRFFFKNKGVINSTGAVINQIINLSGFVEISPVFDVLLIPSNISVTSESYLDINISVAVNADFSSKLTLLLSDNCATTNEIYDINGDQVEIIIN